MADAPPWMTLSEIEGALQPGTDCEEAYLYLEKGTSHSRHRLLMNMLVLNPDEMVKDERDEERTKRMEFYFDKTKSHTPEHLQHKVHLYKVATNLQRADDAYMCDLMGVPYTEDEEMPEAANDEAETAGAEPAGAGSAAADATLPTLYESEGDDDDQVEEGSAGHTQYTFRAHGHHAEDDADQRFAARYWEHNARSLAEERREAAELAAAHGNDLAAPVPPGEPPQPPSSAEPSGAAVQSIEPPRPLRDEQTDEQSSKETSAELSSSKPKAVAADAHQDVVKGAAIAAAAPDDAARLEAAAGYARTMHGLTSQPDDPTNGARSLNEAMALKANDCSMPDRGVEPSDPRASRDLAWLLAHHNALNLTDAPIQWHLAIQEFQHSTFFEQETFAGVAGVRGGDSPLMLACTPIV